MKILYELVITEKTGFTATDFPDKIEILRKGKTPLVFKPVAIQSQEIYARLNEAEALLKYARNINGASEFFDKTINEYFNRYAQ